MDSNRDTPAQRLERPQLAQGHSLRLLASDKPAMGPVPTSDLLSRVSDFLPKLAAAPVVDCDVVAADDGDVEFSVDKLPLVDKADTDAFEELSSRLS